MKWIFLPLVPWVAVVGCGGDAPGPSVPSQEGVASLLSLESMSDRAVRAAAGTGPINRDRRPRLEYAAPRALFLDEESRLLTRFDERLDSSKAGDLLLPGETRETVGCRRMGDLVLDALAKGGA